MTPRLELGTPVQTGGHEVTDTAVRARRPRNRRQLIVDAAAEQFRSSGYHNVGMSDIADAVGITGAALYRHFTGKQELLEAAVQQALDRVTTALAEDGELEDLLRSICALTVHGPAVGVLWGREMAHLPGEVQSSLRGQLVAAVRPIRSAIGRARPDLDEDAVDLLLWATIGVVALNGYHAIKIDAQRFQRRLLDACLDVAGVTLPPARVGTRTRPDGRSLLPASRQEAILTAAARLFGTRGYQAVGMDDIGAAAGITGATIYHHFENKAAILAAALNRCLQAMLFDLSGALDSSSTPGEALDKLLGFFVRTCVEHGPLVGALQNEAINLPADQRRALFSAERDYREEWVALLVAHRDDLSGPEAQILVRAAVSAIAALLAIPRIQRRLDLAAELTQIGRAILGLPTPTASPDSTP
jgi:AcrR family transcriptional regulator